MIISFKHTGLKNYFDTASTAGIQANHAAKVSRILTVLDSAITIQDVNLPGYRLHQLSGKRSDIWSVWINGNWRTTFRYEDGDAEIVNYEDYH